MLTGKCFSLFSLNHNKSQLLFISSSYCKHIRNMNLEVFSRVIMRLGFQKVKHICYLITIFFWLNTFSHFLFSLIHDFQHDFCSFYFFENFFSLLLFINRNRFFLISTFWTFTIRTNHLSMYIESTFSFLKPSKW